MLAFDAMLEATSLVNAIRGEPLQRSTKIDVALVVRQSTGPVPVIKLG